MVVDSLVHGNSISGFDNVKVLGKFVVNLNFVFFLSKEKVSSGFNDSPTMCHERRYDSIFLLVVALYSMIKV